MNKNTQLIAILCSLIISGAASLTCAAPSITLCKKAVLLGQEYITSMENIERQRNEVGRTSAEQYATLLAQLAAQSQTLSLEQCMVGGAEQQVFYQCLIDQTGKVPACQS